ncbi:DNA-binding transcriptional regulator, MarR family [Peptoclostridium litorale DSM 5388]|uniref:HTH marR-type domain-containing protein n=1 Tax=Peptoclostridium litorale DSM 5388 TaxID=1121324 RepID=A0A069RF77_PEPLI|nr:MarR family transcriptional regulator [Peptoclostridium litorale]KDR95651.1 hypothetical protein CLIT_10c03780 [Peptoclostridium litorale DSM 5388]SIO00285.1 DNA-binding transcriptional regulator, MarR family [Peptoclostridium litorale DSM 5388]
MNSIDERDLDVRSRAIRQIFNIRKNMMKKMVDAMGKDNFSKTEIMIIIMVKTQPYKATDLAKEIGIPASTLTGVVDRLVEKGYVERVRDENDRRIVLVKPGRAVIEKAKAAREISKEVFENSKELSSEKWWEELSERLEELEKALEEKSQE